MAVRGRAPRLLDGRALKDENKDKDNAPAGDERGDEGGRPAEGLVDLEDAEVEEEDGDLGEGDGAGVGDFADEGEARLHFGVVFEVGHVGEVFAHADATLFDGEGVGCGHGQLLKFQLHR